MPATSRQLTFRRGVALAGFAFVLTLATLSGAKQLMKIQSLRWDEYRFARLLISHTDGTCRVLQFDNRTAYITSGTDPQCSTGSGPERVQVLGDGGPDSFLSIKRALRGQ
jgi:hypothetical protein